MGKKAKAGKQTAKKTKAAKDALDADFSVAEAKRVYRKWFAAQNFAVMRDYPTRGSVIIVTATPGALDSEWVYGVHRLGRNGSEVDTLGPAAGYGTLGEACDAAEVVVGADDLRLYREESEELCDACLMERDEPLLAVYRYSPDAFIDDGREPAYGLFFIPEHEAHLCCEHLPAYLEEHEPLITED